MKIVRADEARPESIGAFTGDSDLRRLLAAQQPGGIAATIVRFEDGARTNWHVHPGEQALYVLDGQGRAGTESEEFGIGPGDLVYAPPGERHWHGAAPGESMTHLSVTTGGAPEWFGDAGMSQPPHAARVPPGSDRLHERGPPGSA